MLVHDEALLLAYTVSGISLKLADYYGERSNSPVAFTLATLAALCMGMLISSNPVSSSIVIGIVVGVILSRKVNRPNLIYGLILTLITALVFSISLPNPWLLVSVAVSSLIDEFGHERYSGGEGMLTWFFKLRSSLKALMALSAILSLVNMINVLGFFFFDISYDLTSWLIGRLK
jgi:hypothetical protein